MNKDDFTQFLAVIATYFLFIVYHYEIITIKDMVVILLIVTYVVYYKEIRFMLKKIIRKMKQ